MKYTVIIAVMVKGIPVTTAYMYPTLKEATSFIEKYCNDEDIINITINYIKDERENQTMG